MSLEISLTPEVESELRKRASDLNTDLSSLIQDVIQRSIAEADEEDEAADLSYEQWQEEFDAWIAAQTSRNPLFDDSRDSIYE